MSELVTLCRIGFIAFVVCCVLPTVGPGYERALKAEADKVYSVEEIELKRLEIEERQRLDTVSRTNELPGFGAE